MVYVGDNAGKDFVAPRSLGMYSVWFDNEDGLYRDKCENVGVMQVGSLEELQKLFCCN